MNNSWGEGVLASKEVTQEELSSDDSSSSFSSSSTLSRSGSEGSSSCHYTHKRRISAKTAFLKAANKSTASSISSSGDDSATIHERRRVGPISESNYKTHYSSVRFRDLSVYGKLRFASRQLLRPLGLVSKEGSLTPRQLNACPDRKSASGKTHLLHTKRDRSKLKSTSCNAQKQKNGWSCVLSGDLGILKKMYNFSIKYHIEICIILFLFASGMPFLRSKPLKTRSVQSPGPFFDSEDSSVYIEDHYTGDYLDLVQKKIPRSPSFVFYYAPWDSECLVAKTVFLEVARHFRLKLGDQVKFYAVNCWWPEGQCRRNYKNLSHYPIFVAHLSSAGGIIYNGPIRVELMIRFINLILSPITRIDSEEELWRFRAQHDAVMLAFFNFTVPTSAASYDVYLQMALRHLEADPLGQVGYGVFVQKSLADKYFVGSSNSISLVLFNEIHTAKWHGAFSAQDSRAPVKQVVDWVMERTRVTPITWAYRIRSGFSNRPVSLGSVDLAQESANGPILLLITKRYYPSAHSPLYMQFKEVALDYFNCNKSGNVTKLRRYSHKINGEWLKIWTLVQEKCKHAAIHKSAQCDTLRRELQNWQPSLFRMQRESLAYFEKHVSEGMNFTGFSCRSQRPFRFIAIDPSDVPYFLDMLLGTAGIPGGSVVTQNESLAFIIDAQRHYMSRLPSLKASNIAEAVYAYSQGNLPNTESAALGTQISRHTTSPETLHAYTGTKLLRNKNVLVEEISSDELVSIIEDDRRHSTEMKLVNRDPMFVMYTAQFCGFCGVVLAHFISLARFLTQYNVNIRLTKVNIFKKSLPEFLEPGEIPSFLFLPANNRSDIRLYPPGKSITTKNLLQFVLSELDAESRVAMSLRSPLCSSNTNNNIDKHLLNSVDQNAELPFLLQPGKDKHTFCLSLNRKLVTAQIHSVLKTVKGCNSNETATTFRMENIQQQDNSYNDYNYYGRDKLFFMQRLAGMHAFVNSSSSVGYCRQSVHDNFVNRGDFLRSDVLASWSYQVLDHLRSTRLILEVA